MRRAVGNIPARVNTGRPAHFGRGGKPKSPQLDRAREPTVLFTGPARTPSQATPFRQYGTGDRSCTRITGFEAQGPLCWTTPAWLRETESNRPYRLMRPDWSHSSYPATNLLRLFGCQRSQTSLAQGEGLEPSPAGLESAMLPVTPTLHVQTWTRAEASTWRAPPGRRRSH